MVCGTTGEKKTLRNFSTTDQQASGFFYGVKRMALARVVYTQSTSGNKNFTVPFPYISRDHVKVTVNGAPASFTWLNTNTVQIDPAPAVGAVVEKIGRAHV